MLETNWCVTLDRVPEALYPEVAANGAQCREWVKLFAADEITGDLTNGAAGWSDPPPVDFLKANPYLVVDTRHFDRDFTDCLLAALSDAGPLDERMDGLLVHGENFPGVESAAGAVSRADQVRIHRSAVQHGCFGDHLQEQLQGFVVVVLDARPRVAGTRVPQERWRFVCSHRR